MTRVYTVDSIGRVSLRNVSKKTLDKYYFRTQEKYYVYKKARFAYDPLNNTFGFEGAKRKNRRSGRKQYLWVRAEPSKKTVLAIAVTIACNFCWYQGSCQESPFPIVDETFYVSAKVMNEQFGNYDFGTYEENWKNGLLSDVLHGLQYNGIKRMYDGRWRMWRDGMHDDKIAISNPQEVKRKLVLPNKDALIFEMDAKLENIYSAYVNRKVKR
jgi:hypothetical protein